MGNSASSLPYSIENETHPSSRPGSYGFSIHSGKRKSDGLPVTVFKAEKKTLAKTPLVKTNPDPTLTQIFPALLHFQKIKTMIHPHILRAYATLDTDFPKGNDDPAQSSTLDAMSNPSSLTALEQTPTTGDLIIVTEQVVPLIDYLNTIQEAPSADNQNPDLIAWGLHNLISSLVFLHHTAKLSHSNICPHSIYVTPSGDFKLSTFNLLTPIGIDDGAVGPTSHFKHFERDVTPKEYRSPERIEARWDLISNSSPHIIDSFSLGVFLEELYSHPGSGTGGAVPEKLVKAVKRLQTPNVRMRPRLAPLLKCPIFDNPHVKAQLFLDSITAKPMEEKVSFLQSLVDLMRRGILNKNVAVHKVLPLLIASIKQIASTDGAMGQDVTRRECLATIPPLFYIFEFHLQDGPEESKTSFTSVVEVLFGINDRGVRGTLLQKVTLLTKHMDATSINKSVFEPMCSGFTDSSAPLRELTLKTTICLVQYLTPANLEKLVRYLIRMQSDTENSIRTNTVIFIGKVAPTLTDTARSKLILPAFTRAMKDPFTPCRLAALKAVMTCREYFDYGSVAREVLPCIVPHLLDEASDVRNEAFGAVDCLLVGLRGESERMAETQRRNRSMEKGVTSTNDYSSGSVSNVGYGSSGTTATAPLSSGSHSAGSEPSSGTGYFSSLGSWASSKITSSAVGDDVAPAPSQSNATTSSFSSATKISMPMGSKIVSEPPKAPPAEKEMPKFSSLSLSDANIGSSGGGGDGWAHDDDDDDDSPFGDNLMTNTASASNNGIKIPAWATGNDHDFMSQFDKKPSLPAGGIRSGVGASSGGAGKLTIPSKKGKTGMSLAQRKAELLQKKEKQKGTGLGSGGGVIKLKGSGGIDDGWDDF